MHGPDQSYGERIPEDTIVFDAKNRADKISIILFGDYANEVLPLTPLFLAGRNIDAPEHPPIRSFLEFYGVGGPNSWVLNDVGGDLRAEDLQSHPYRSVIGEIDPLVKVVNVHLKRSRLEEASQEAKRIIQILRSRTPKYHIKHSSGEEK